MTIPTYTSRLLDWLAADWRRMVGAAIWLTALGVAVGVTIK